MWGQKHSHFPRFLPLDISCQPLIIRIWVLVLVNNSLIAAVVQTSGCSPCSPQTPVWCVQRIGHYVWKNQSPAQGIESLIWGLWSFESPRT